MLRERTGVDLAAQQRVEPGATGSGTCRYFAECPHGQFTNLEAVLGQVQGRQPVQRRVQHGQLRGRDQVLSELRQVRFG